MFQKDYQMYLYAVEVKECSFTNNFSVKIFAALLMHIDTDGSAN